MNICDFSAWFQLFIGLNFAYAGSEIFRNYFDVVFENLIDLEDAHYARYDRVHMRISSKYSGMTKVPGNERYIKKMEKVRNQFKNPEKIVTYESIFETDFVNCFKPLFFVNALYCMFFLAICGFKAVLNPSEVIFFFLIANTTLIFFATIIFLRTMVGNEVDKPLGASWSFLILLVVPVLIFIFLKFSLIPNLAKPVP